MKKLIAILFILLISAPANALVWFNGGGGGGDATTLHGLTLEVPDAADDGKLIQYDHGTTSWILYTPVGLGDMTIAVWDGDADGFIDADAGGTDIDTSASTGTARVDAGVWSINAATTGTVVTATTNFTIGGTVITDGVVTEAGLSLAGGTVDVTTGPLTVGVADTTPGQLYLQGGADTEGGGVLRWYLDAVDQGGGIDHYSAIVVDDDLLIGSDGDTDMLKFIAETSITATVPVDVDAALTATSVTADATVTGEHLASTDDADIVDNLTAGDIIIDEAAGVLAFSGATSAVISTADETDLTIDVFDDSANATLTIDNTGNQGIDVIIGADGGSGSIALYSEQGAPDYTLKFSASGSMTESTEYVWPVAYPDSAKYLQSSDAGVLSWVSEVGAYISLLDPSVNEEILIWDGVAGDTVQASGITIESATSDIHFGDDDEINLGGSDDALLEYQNAADALVVQGIEGVGMIIDMGDEAIDAAQTYVEIVGTTPVHTAGVLNDVFLNIDPEIGNASGGTITADIIKIDPITQSSAQVTLNAINIGAVTTGAGTETAILVGTGWDAALSAGELNITNVGIAYVDTLDADGAALAIGAGSDQTVAIDSSDWTIDATGIMAGMGNITSDGTIQGTTLTDGTFSVTAGAVTGATTIVAGTSVDITGATGLILENDETITNSVDGTVLITGILDLASAGITNSGAIADDGAITVISSGGTVTVESVVFTGDAVTGVGSLTATTLTDGTASLSAGALTGLTTPLSVSQGGTGSDLSDPAADRLIGWDNTGNTIQYFILGAGLSYDEGTDTISATGAATAWDDLTVPDANEALDHTDYYTEWDFGDVDHDMFTFFGTGNFGDFSVVRIEQKTGTPTDGDLLSLVTANATVDHLVLDYAGTDYVTHKVVDAGTYTIDVTSDGTAAVSLPDPVIFGSTATFADDQLVRFGGAATDWYVEFDDSAEDQLLWHTTANGSVGTDHPMFEILADFDTALGANITADQLIFGVSKGTVASNTQLFTVDEDGDVEIAGTLTLPESHNPGWYFNEDSGQDWWFYVNDSSNSIELRMDSAPGTKVAMEWGEDYSIAIGGNQDADIVIEFDATTNDGTITYMEDEDRFDFDTDISVSGFVTGYDHLEEIASGDADAYTMTAADIGGTITNQGDDDVLTITLMEASTWYTSDDKMGCVTILDVEGLVITVDPADGVDQILWSTCAVGDSIDSAGDVGNLIKLCAVGANEIAVFGAIGTWVDGD